MPGKVHLTVDQNAMPQVVPPKRLPVAIKPQLKKELDVLSDRKVMMKEDDPTEWVSQLATTTKKNGDLRICIDPQPLNKALKREHYQLPDIDDILPDLGKAKVFSKFDMQWAFWHLELDEESSKLTTFETPYGRYRWLRLPFGLKVSSEIFQKRLTTALDGLNGVKCIADDITVLGIGDTYEEACTDHDMNMEAFLQRCKENGIKLNLPKSKIKCKEMLFSGHQITSDGLKADDTKVKDILDMPKPQNVHDVQRLNGMINYLSRYLPNLSDTMKPIRQLTNKDVDWHWNKEQDDAFDKIKKMITSAPVLTYYRPELPLILQCDASDTGIGVAILQDGKPLAYASKALTDTETRYAVIEKEMLAIVFGMERFHQYTFGRPVVVNSDHQPLETICKKPLNKVPKRLQGMLMTLQKYDFEVKYKKGKSMHLADTLSRAYVKNPLDKTINFETVNSVVPIKESKLQQLKEATRLDETSLILKRLIMNGWPEERENVPNLAQPYFNVRDELAIQDGLIFRGERVIVPEEMRSDMKSCVHSSHMGIEACRRRARECLYWPNMNDEIKQFVSKCETCRKFERAQPNEPLNPTIPATRPYEKVGSDLFQFDGKDYLITVDYFSDFFEVDKLDKTTSKAVIKKLKSHFSRNGIPNELVTDNGPQYDSDEFKTFAKEWNFDHLTSSPGHAKGNGKAESAVKIAKNLMRKAKDSGKDPYIALLDYRNTPTQGLNTSPAQRLFNRRTRTLLPTTAKLLEQKTLDPIKTVNDIQRKKDKMKFYYDRTSKPLKPLEEGDVIRMKPFNMRNKTWKKAKVTERLDDRSYLVETDYGMYRRNRQDLKSSNETTSPTTQAPQMAPLPMQVPEPKLPTPQKPSVSKASPRKQTIHTNMPKQSSPEPHKTRSGRVSKPPKYLSDFDVK